MSTLAITAPGGPELIVILVIVILLFGAKKLPELGSSVGRSIKNFKQGLGEGQKDDEEETPSSTSATPDQP
jgi:sec-independent protein translocase protein TatA